MLNAGNEKKKKKPLSKPIKNVISPRTGGDEESTQVDGGIFNRGDRRTLRWVRGQIPHVDTVEVVVQKIERHVVYLNFEVEDVHEVDVDVCDPCAYASAFKWVKGGEEGVENVHFDGLENVHEAVVAVRLRCQAPCRGGGRATRRGDR